MVAVADKREVVAVRREGGIVDRGREGVNVMYEAHPRKRKNPDRFVVVANEEPELACRKGTPGVRSAWG